MNNTQQLLMKISNDTSAIRQRLEDHIENSSAHHLAPCDPHKDLSKKLWGIGMMAFASLVGVVWKYIKP